MTDRSRFDWFVFSSVWDRVVEHGEAQYGENAEKNGYLVRIIETAMREVLRNNRHSEVEDKVHELVETLGVKKTDLPEDEIADGFQFNPEDYSETTRVAKHVDTALLERWKAHADSFDEKYGVHLSRTLEYYLWGGQPKTLTDRLDRVLDEIERDQDDTLSTPEKIADRLDDTFTREEFKEAARAEGVGTERYALREHLPTVIDEKDVWPHPENPDKFIPKGSDTIPDTPDPSTLPYQAMDKDDKKLTIKAAAVQRINGLQGNDGVKFTVSDAVATLDGKPKRGTVRSLMQSIADDNPDNGFWFDSDSGELRFDREHVLDAKEANRDAITLGLGDPDDVEEDSTDDHKQEASDWVGHAIENLQQMDIDLADAPDPVLNNKIARAKFPDWRTGDDEVPLDAVKKIDEDDRQKVFEAIYSRGDDSAVDADITSYSAAMVERDLDDGWVQITPSGTQEAGADD